MMQDSRHFPNGEHIGDIGVLSVSFLKWHNIDIFHPFNGDHIFTQGSDDLALVPKITGLFVCPSLEKPLSLIHISEPRRLGMNSYAVFCLKKKKRGRGQEDRTGRRTHSPQRARRPAAEN